MSGPDSSTGEPVRPGIALALASVGFFALTIFGFGMTSLALDADVIAVSGLGQWPGIVGMLLALAAFAGVLSTGMWAPHPSYLLAPVVAVAVFLAELLGIVVGGTFSGAPPGAAVAAAGAMATSWFGAVLGAAAFIAAWAGIAVVRTRSARPRWPWERSEPED